MNEGAPTFNATAKASGWRFTSPAEALRVLASKTRPWARFAGVLLSACLLLVSLFVVHIAALELSDRIGFFPLYGFFLVNLLVGLSLTGFIVVSRKASSRSSQSVGSASPVLPRRLRELWDGLAGTLNARKATAPALTVPNRVAVLLVIKRRASEEAQPEARAASASARVI